MAEVDPFLLPIPKALLEDKETRDFFEYFVRWAHDLWIRTGGGSDAISNQGIKELYPWVQKPSAGVRSTGELYPIVPGLSALKAGQFEVIEVTADHTTAGNEILICNNTSLITITLSATADHKEQAIVVRNGAGGVKVTAVKKISGKTTKTILRRYSAPHHIFTTEADTWNVI